MESKTKNNINLEDIKKVFDCYFKGSNVTEIKELKDGCFNMSYLVGLENGDEVVLKIAPPDVVELLIYEKDIMLTEVKYHNLVSKTIDIPVPQIICSDFSKNIIPYNYFIMQKLHGKPLNRCEPISDKQRKTLYLQLAKYLALIHDIKGEYFGYEVLKEDFVGKGYYESFKIMFNYLIEDADKKDIKLPISSEELFALLDRYSYTFKNIIEPVFVHYDLWDGNIFVTDMDNSPTIEGLIDFERGYFADPAADFSQMAGYIDLEKNSYFIDEYNKYAKKKFELGEAELIRIQLYRLYVLTIMVVESYYRDVDGSYNDQLKWATDEFLKLYTLLN
ncbi:MAG: aminoglycoside phosphotransferase family protein [Spirochaetaceae bacterium]